MRVRKVSLWDKVFKPLKGLGQSTCKSLLSSCIYLQREIYLKMTQPTNPSFLSPEHSQMHTLQYAQLVLTPTASPFRMCSGWSQAHLGCEAAGLCVTSFLVVKEDGFPSGRSLCCGVGQWELLPGSGAVLECYHLFCFHSLGYCQCSLLLHPQLLVSVLEDVKNGSGRPGKY